MERWSGEVISRALGAAVANKSVSPERFSAFSGTSQSVGNRIPDDHFASEAMGFGMEAARPGPGLQRFAGRIFNSQFIPSNQGKVTQARPGRGEVA